MPSKLNSEFNYRYQIIGNTPWKKIQILRGFLEGRIQAAAQEKISALRRESQKCELAHLKEIGALRHVILNLEASILETESARQTEIECFKLNLEEIETIKKLIAEYLAIAEPTRIDGYTDEQMYEANENYEFTINVCREIQAEMIANGRPSPAKLLNAMSNPQSLEALKTLGIVPQETLLMCDKHIPMQLVDYLKLDCAKEKIPLK